MARKDLHELLDNALAEQGRLEGEKAAKAQEEANKAKAGTERLANESDKLKKEKKIQMAERKKAREELIKLEKDADQKTKEIAVILENVEHKIADLEKDSKEVSPSLRSAHETIKKEFAKAKDSFTRAFEKVREGSDAEVMAAVKEEAEEENALSYEQKAKRFSDEEMARLGFNELAFDKKTQVEDFRKVVDYFGNDFLHYLHLYTRAELEPYLTLDRHSSNGEIEKKLYDFFKFRFNDRLDAGLRSGHLKWKSDAYRFDEEMVHEPIVHFGRYIFEEGTEKMPTYLRSPDQAYIMEPKEMEEARQKLADFVAGRLAKMQDGGFYKQEQGNAVGVVDSMLGAIHEDIYRKKLHELHAGEAVRSKSRKEYAAMQDEAIYENDRRDTEKRLAEEKTNHERFIKESKKKFNEALESIKEAEATVSKTARGLVNFWRQDDRKHLRLHTEPVSDAYQKLMDRKKQLQDEVQKKKEELTAKEDTFFKIGAKQVRSELAALQIELQTADETIVVWDEEHQSIQAKVHELEQEVENAAKDYREKIQKMNLLRWEMQAAEKDPRTEALVKELRIYDTDPNTVIQKKFPFLYRDTVSNSRYYVGSITRLFEYYGYQR